MIDERRISRILRVARDEGASALLETEGMEILQALGIHTPGYVFVTGVEEAAASDLQIPGDTVVVKVLSRRILHKTDVGGVAVIPNRRDSILAAVASMERAFAGTAPAGFTVNEFIRYDPALGNELLVGARWTEEFGPVVTFGAGGIYAEFLGSVLEPGKDVAILDAELPEPEIGPMIERPAVAELAAGKVRAQKPRIDLASIRGVVCRFMQLARTFVPGEISECEVNPLVVSGGRLVALDALVKLGAPGPESPVPRPVHKIRNLLEPRSAAIVGVSEKLNPGRIILRNLLRDGFPREAISIVKRGVSEIEGCRCCPDIPSIPHRVDLLVLSIDAAQACAAIAQVTEGRKAESIILIPGGLEEKAGTDRMVANLRRVLQESRRTDWQGPVINGGNCLGITSRPGRYDTMFIPEHKLPVPDGPVSPVAILSQSGAFAVAQASKLGRINPKYTITLGNQMDLTLGDYLTYLESDLEIEVFAVYAEGFRPLDGKRFLKAARAITASGRTVILYRAGRGAAGAQAAASHTASLAGDYAVTRQLARAAGVLVSESPSDFVSLLRLCTLLRRRTVRGRRLGALSNAGFECVSIADHLGGLQLSVFSDATRARLRQIFGSARIDQVVDIHNPIDLTPMTGDAAFAEAVRAVLHDDDVDIGLVGCVPLTAALSTLPPGDTHREDFQSPDSLPQRLIRLNGEVEKPWVAVIDSGGLYDPMAALLEEGGIPTFRGADHALRLLNLYSGNLENPRAGLFKENGGRNRA